MEHDSISFHYGNTGITNIHPIILVALFAAGILIFLLNRRYVLIPLLFVGLLTPMGQRFVIAGLDFTVLRVLLIFAWIRLFIRSEYYSIRLNSIDKVLILWVVSNVVAFTLLWQTVGALINRLGFAYDSIGIYFLFRCFVKDFEDIDRVIKVLTIISVIIAASMLNEQITGRNIFSIFGGVPEFTNIRVERLRSQSAFAHPILAGTFGATLLPLIVSQWWKERINKKFVLLGFVSVTIITLTSASSGPIIAYFAGIFGLLMWPFRKHMRMISWGILGSLISLHLIMKAPVWALIGRIGVVGGSSDYHRFKVVDEFIKRFGEWWLFGTKSTDHWGWSMWDDQNHYVSQGTTSGVFTLILFIAIIVLCFRTIGLNMKTMKHSKMRHRLWAFGAAVFAHSVAFMGVSYFDQTIVAWYLLVAIISTMSSSSKKLQDLD